MVNYSITDMYNVNILKEYYSVLKSDCSPCPVLLKTICLRRNTLLVAYIKRILDKSTNNLIPFLFLLLNFKCIINNKLKYLL